MSGSGLGRILIVDDEQTVRDVLAEYFTEQGYAVGTAESGLDALKVLETFRPDLVLLDIRMPGIDGVETLRRLREVAPAVSVIMVTANEDVALARDTLKIGALDYVSKPFDFAYLEQSVMAGLVNAGARRPGQATPATHEPLPALAQVTFRVVRGMAEAARAALAEVELLLTVAAGLGDLTGADLSQVQEAVTTAREALGG